MKNLYEFLEEKYEQFEEEMTLDEFIESFINENFCLKKLRFNNAKC